MLGEGEKGEAGPGGGVMSLGEAQEGEGGGED
jgi:hypothetical protein